MTVSRGSGSLIAALVLAAVAASVTARAQPAEPPFPFVYSTDLYYTIEDIDDHFDAAVLLKCPELDIKGVILDNHTYPTDGQKVMARLMKYSGRQVPVARGLGAFKMRSFEDKAFHVDGQEGVELILETLAESDAGVALMAVGSMTDLAVAYLRDPALLAAKASAVYVVAGSADSPAQDYNVRLDPRAFVTIMRSKLPIIWVPVDSSMWYFPAPKLLAPPRNMLSHFLLNELLYWYLRNDARRASPRNDRYLFHELGRWMWSTPGFVHAVRHPDAAAMFDLVPVKVAFDDDGVMTSIRRGASDSNITMVTNVDGARLNEFIVSRINR